MSSDASRAAFESFAITLYKNISLEKDDGKYRYALAQTGWEYWQASRKQALEDAVCECVIVSFATFADAEPGYVSSRSAGAVACRNKIKELLK